MTSREQLRRAKISAGIGNFVTWYDFGVYGFLAIVLSRVFFPPGDEVASLLATFAIFGVAFLMEPVGAFIFGRIGDRTGRKTLLVVVITIMSCATLLMGVLPTFEAIGLWAPALLLALRMTQGLAAGGEPGGVAPFLVESASADRRARTVSFWHFSSYLANAAASVTVLLLFLTLSPDQMNDFGWRIPFIIAAPIGFVGLYIRLKLTDSDQFEEMKREGTLNPNPIRSVFKFNLKTVFQVIGCGAFQYSAFYFVTIYMETYLKSEVGVSDTLASMSTVITLAIASIAIFGFARVSDRIGRKPIMIAAMIICVVCTFPAFLLFATTSPMAIITGHVLLGLSLAMFMSASGAALVEIFPADVRSSGFAIGFNIAGAAFGGTVGYVSTYLMDATGSAFAPAGILVVAGLIAFFTVLTMRETANVPLQGSSTESVEKRGLSKRGIV